ncbi:hypothetical protein KGQ20_40965 [Catenulispora sp. NF23]|uniref:Lipoprotein n=1 Tax=Catenulispora pinistramenti TaxID=2705254 RepID=A0ABS5L493_9ACTN|nr:hypothetical protein [Catenulispora pinistramenti]MBS2539139.1 hypothetical protein [Catenulispora pinistramenti]MBS2553132.1 hypothetical protein [Catenulispora pinistramenti]
MPSQNTTGNTTAANGAPSTASGSGGQGTTAGTTTGITNGSDGNGTGGNGGNSAGNGSGWVLSAPKSVFGFAQIQPQAASLAKIQSGLATTAGELGVSGSQVIAVYDDPTHDVYVIFAGYNGSGFDPGKLKPVFSAGPKYTTDGTGDHLVENHVLYDPGTHGGSAGCTSTMVQSGGLAAESTACVWMTATTMGSVTYYPKPDQQKMVFGTGPEVMGKVMQQLRDQVEHKS